MMNIRGVVKLALTKLRTRKLRLTITISMASLLFGVLFFALPIARGTFDSIEQFGKEGLGSRYITQATLPSQGSAINDDAITERALEIHRNTLNQKKTAAKKLGVAFDTTTETSPITEFDTPTGKIRNLNMQHPAAKAAVKEYLAQHPLIGDKELHKAADSFRPIAFYDSKQYQNGFSGGQIQPLKNGQENFTSTQSSTQDPLDMFTSSWTSIDNQLIEPFVLPGQSLIPSETGVIPLVIPFSAAESLLQINPLPNNASADATIKHVEKVRAKAANLTFDMCYRNQASANLIAATLSTQQEMERNKKNADYQKPSLIYRLPSDACGTPSIVADTRTAPEKTLSAKQVELDRMFGVDAPTQQKLHFAVVGISPDKKDGNATSVNQIIGSAVNSSLGYGWYMPSSVEKQNPLVAELFSEDAYYIGLGHSYYAEFASADSARNFINEKGCSVDSAMRSENDTCAKDGKLFSLAAFGSNTVGLESLKQQFNKLYILVLIGIAVVASLVMSSMFGRIITDSRKETAVFRAIGAKRSDIAGIYLAYTTILSLMIVIVALVFGIGAAYIVSTTITPLATAQALAVYGSQDTSMVFNLFQLNLKDIVVISGLILAVGYAASLFPLFKNVKRNPIRDMRDDG